MTNTLLDAMLTFSEQCQKLAEVARETGHAEVNLRLQNAGWSIAKALVACLKDQAPAYNRQCICGHRRGNHTVPGSECAHVHCDCATFKGRRDLHPPQPCHALPLPRRRPSAHPPHGARRNLARDARRRLREMGGCVVKLHYPYAATYQAEPVLGEHGWSYRCFCRGQPIFEGWSRGRKSEAEAEVRRGIEAREALRACVEAN